MDKIVDAVAIVRIKQGLVGESEREAHLVEVFSLDGLPDEMMTLCRKFLRFAQVDQLEDMPKYACMVCMAKNGVVGMPMLADAFDRLDEALTKFGGFPPLLMP
jgi:hypothetical protein